MLHLNVINLPERVQIDSSYLIQLIADVSTPLEDSSLRHPSIPLPHGQLTSPFATAFCFAIIAFAPFCAAALAASFWNWFGPSCDATFNPAGLLLRDLLLLLLREGSVLLAAPGGLILLPPLPERDL